MQGCEEYRKVTIHYIAEYQDLIAQVKLEKTKVSLHYRNVFRIQCEIKICRN